MAKRKKKEYSYDVDNPFDRPMIFDKPFSEFNKKGRKAKKKYMKSEGLL